MGVSVSTCPPASSGLGPAQVPHQHPGQLPGLDLELDERQLRQPVSVDREGSAGDLRDGAFLIIEQGQGRLILPVGKHLADAPQGAAVELADVGAAGVQMTRL
jgi:hypothetical protein